MYFFNRFLFFTQSVRYCGENFSAAFSLFFCVFGKNYYGVLRLLRGEKAAEPPLAYFLAFFIPSGLRRCGFSRGAHGFGRCRLARALGYNGA